MQLGLSIGGRIKDYDQTNDGWEIKDIDLFEISLTGMPANYDTFGTVTTAKNVDVVETKWSMPYFKKKHGVKQNARRK